MFTTREAHRGCHKPKPRQIEVNSIFLGANFARSVCAIGQVISRQSTRRYTGETTEVICIRVQTALAYVRLRQNPRTVRGGSAPCACCRGVACPSLKVNRLEVKLKAAHTIQLPFRIPGPAFIICEKSARGCTSPSHASPHTT